VPGKVEQLWPGQRCRHTPTVHGSCKYLGAGGIGRIPFKNVATTVSLRKSLRTEFLSVSKVYTGIAAMRRSIMGP
jgi:hypothetical protein